MTSVSIFKKLSHQASTADKTLIHIAIAMEITTQLEGNVSLICF